MATYGGEDSKDSDSIGEDSDPKLQQKNTGEIFEFPFFGDGSDSDRPTSWKEGKHIGSGSFGNVYEVEDSPQHMNLAVKQVPRSRPFSGEEKADLFPKLEVLKRLSHPRIVQFYGFCESTSVLFLFMERMKGGSLDERLKDESKQHLDASSIRSVLRQMLEGVSYLHSKRTFHGDIKSANILMDEHLQIKLVDFGLYKVFQQFWPADVPLGTIRWMAPEMFYPSNDYSYEVDIWGIGCTVVEMVTRKHPFHNLKEYPHVFFKLMSPDPSPAYDLPAACPPNLRDFLNEVFQKDRSKRPSVRDVLLGNPFVTGDDSGESLMKKVRLGEGREPFGGQALNKDDQVIGDIPVVSNHGEVKHILQKKFTARRKSEKLRPEDEQAIKRHWVWLIEELDATAVVEELTSLKVFNVDDKSEILGHTFRKKRTEIFLQKLLNAGPGSAFKLFLEVLDKYYRYIADALRE